MGAESVQSWKGEVPDLGLWQPFKIVRPAFIDLT